MSRIIVKVNQQATVFEIKEFGFEGQPDRVRLEIVAHGTQTHIPVMPSEAELTSNTNEQYITSKIVHWIPQRKQWVGFYRTKGHHESDRLGSEDYIYGPYWIPDLSSATTEQQNETEALGDLNTSVCIHEEW